MAELRYDIRKVRTAAAISLSAAAGLSIALVAGRVGGSFWVASIGIAWGITLALAVMTLGMRGSTSQDRILSRMWAWVLVCGAVAALIRALPGQSQLGIWFAVAAMFATIMLVGHGKVFRRRDQP